MPVTEVTKIALRSFGPMPALWSALQRDCSPSSSACWIQVLFACPQVVRFLVVIDGLDQITAFDLHAFVEPVENIGICQAMTPVVLQCLR